jgi:hypothetical protein
MACRAAIVTEQVQLAVQLIVAKLQDVDVNVPSLFFIDTV